MSQNPIGSKMEQQQTQQNIDKNGLQQQQYNSKQKKVKKKAYVKIIEQPSTFRFRYECEGRLAGSIPGKNTTPWLKTYPTIEIVGYKGRAVVVVSCVTKEMPYRPHPHNLVSKEGCNKGVCTLEINSETMRAVFNNLGIQSVKKNDIEKSLNLREEIRVDPFNTGFKHRCQPWMFDLYSVRLCFQVFIEGEQKGRFTQPLPPVVSEPIIDKKILSNLVICSLCSCSASVLGNNQLMMQCEKVAKDDIAVRFFEEKNGQQVWEAYGEFQQTDVHKQYSIKFKTPRYHTLDISEPAKVFIQLRRPSDGMTSEPLPFQYKPLDSEPMHLKRKRQKIDGDPKLLLPEIRQEIQQHQNLQDDTEQNKANGLPLTFPRQTRSPDHHLQHQQEQYFRILTLPRRSDLRSGETRDLLKEHPGQGSSPRPRAATTMQQYFGGSGTGNAAIIADNMELPNFNPFITHHNLMNHDIQQQQHNYHLNPFSTFSAAYWKNIIDAATMSTAKSKNNIGNLNKPLATNNLLTTSNGSDRVAAGNGVNGSSGGVNGSSGGVNGSSGGVNASSGGVNGSSGGVNGSSGGVNGSVGGVNGSSGGVNGSSGGAVAIELTELTTCNGRTNGKVHINNNNTENGSLSNKNNKKD